MSNPPSLDEILRAAKRMQAHVEQAQAEISKSELETRIDDTKLVMSGEYEVLGITLGKNFHSLEPTDQERLLTDLYNEARQEVERMLRDRLMQIDQKSQDQIQTH